MNKIFLFVVIFFSFMFVKPSFVEAESCSTTTPHTTDSSKSPTIWQKLEGGVNKYVVTFTISSNQPSGAAVIYQVEGVAGSFTAYDQDANGSLYCRTSHIINVGSLPENKTVSYMIKIWNNTDKNSDGVETGNSIQFSVPAGLNFEALVLDGPRIPSGGTLPEITITATTNAPSVKSIMITRLSNGDTYGPPGSGVTHEVAEFKKTDLVMTHNFRMSSLVPDTYNYVVYAAYQSGVTPFISRPGSFSVDVLPVSVSHSVDPTTGCVGKQPHCIVFNVNTGSVPSSASVVIRLPENASVMCPSGLSTSTKSSLGCTYESDELKDNTSRTSHSIIVGNITNLGTYTYTVYASDPTSARAGNSTNSSFTINPASTPTPTPIATAVSCGLSVGVTCCATTTTPIRSYCSGAGLYCLPINDLPKCQNISDRNATIDEWSAAFGSFNENLDFNDDNTTNGVDYALWLKAGHIL